jgi:16S rRNA (guanine966-N2)-methyltransferase
MLRLIAGSYKGRKLHSPEGSSTRPTSARVREALFSMLGDVSGLAVLDLFAGSGALGLEAISRGAGPATFIDSDKKATDCIRKNLDLVGAEGVVIESDWNNALGRLAGDGARFDLVFVDPPYSQADTLGSQLAARISAVSSPGALIVAESDRANPIELGLTVKRERVYGGTLLRIHESK